MYKRLDSEKNSISDEYVDGLITILNLAKSQHSYTQRGNMLCPCVQCKNIKRHDAYTGAACIL